MFAFLFANQHCCQSQEDSSEFIISVALPLARGSILIRGYVIIAGMCVLLPDAEPFSLQLLLRLFHFYTGDLFKQDKCHLKHECCFAFQD